MARFYWTCPKCGANLDPGEHCTCDKESEDEKPKKHSCGVSCNMCAWSPVCTVDEKMASPHYVYKKGE